MLFGSLASSLTRFGMIASVRTWPFRTRLTSTMKVELMAAT
jgi:hypothetical protein